MFYSWKFSMRHDLPMIHRPPAPTLRPLLPSYSPNHSVAHLKVLKRGTTHKLAVWNAIQSLSNAATATNKGSKKACEEKDIWIFFFFLQFFSFFHQSIFHTRFYPRSRSQRSAGVFPRCHQETQSDSLCTTVENHCTLLLKKPTLIPVQSSLFWHKA